MIYADFPLFLRIYYEFLEKGGEFRLTDMCFPPLEAGTLLPSPEIHNKSAKIGEIQHKSLQA